MVRKNQDPPRESKGFDGDKGVNLSEELAKAGQPDASTAYPQGEPNREPVDVRGDAVPEKKG